MVLPQAWFANNVLRAAAETRIFLVRLVARQATRQTVQRRASTAQVLNFKILMPKENPVTERAEPT